MNKIGFEKDGLKYKLNDFLVFEGLIGNLKNTEHPFYLFEFDSKHLGFAILKKEELKAFESDYKKIEFNKKEHPIKEKYFFSSNINDIFLKLMENKRNEFNYEMFDKIIVENK